MNRFKAADLITMVRIPLSIGFLFVPIYSLSFFVLYISAGITDVLDGYVARLTGKETKFGEVLDSFADLIFWFCLCYSVFRPLFIPTYVWILVIGIGILKVSLFLFASYRSGRFYNAHTFFNRFIGIILFFFPIFILIAGRLWVIYMLTACILSTIFSLLDWLQYLKVYKRIR